jgi:single-stranded DNA-binding protein
MTMHMLASGALIADPQPREAANGRRFATALIRADEAALVSVIAFGEAAERVLEFAKGDALAASGKAKLTAWTGRDGIEKHGISVLADQIIFTKPRRRISAKVPRQSHSVLRPAREARSPLPHDRADGLWTGLAP